MQNVEIRHRTTGRREAPLQTGLALAQIDQGDRIDLPPGPRQQGLARRHGPAAFLAQDGDLGVGRLGRLAAVGQIFRAEHQPGLIRTVRERRPSDVVRGQIGQPVG